MAEMKGGQEHSVTLRGRQSLLVTAVDHLESFDDQAVVLATPVGTLVIRGEDLHLNKLDLGDGTFEVTGKIQSLGYGENRKGKSKGLLEKIKR